MHNIKDFNSVHCLNRKCIVASARSDLQSVPILQCGSYFVGSELHFTMRLLFRWVGATMRFLFRWIGATIWYFYFGGPELQ